jgi:hypothetical protein
MADGEIRGFPGPLKVFLSLILRSMCHPSCAVALAHNNRQVEPVWVARRNGPQPKLRHAAGLNLVGVCVACGRCVRRPERYERTMAIARTQLDEAGFNTAWAEGRALTLSQAIALALEEPHG